MSTKWGIISTAHINRLVLAGARESELVDVLAVCSRDQSRAEEYAREWEIELPIFMCPGCGGAGRVEVASGDEFEVESIEVEEAECIAPR